MNEFNMRELTQKAGPRNTEGKKFKILKAEFRNSGLKRPRKYTKMKR